MCKTCQSLTTNCIDCEKIGGKCLKCNGDLVPVDGNKCGCPKNLYLEDLKNATSSQCKPCKDGTICNVGQAMLIEKSYWRSGNESDIILECKNNPDSCVGGEAGNGLCKKGYLGALCEDCDIENSLGDGRYSHSSDYECISCD